MFTGYCISSPMYVLTKLFGLQPQLFFVFFLIPPSLLLPICIWPIQETMWKSVLTSQTDKMRQMTAEHMAQRDILIWPTQTVFPEIHIREAPPAAKAKTQRVGTTKRAICHVKCAALRVGRDSQQYLNLKRWKKKKNPYHVLRKCYGDKHCFANTVTGGVAVS